MFSEDPQATSFPFGFFSSHLNYSFITKYREYYGLNLCLQYTQTHISFYEVRDSYFSRSLMDSGTVGIIHIYRQTHILFYDVRDSYFFRALCDSGTVEIIGPIASTVEDVVLV